MNDHETREVNYGALLVALYEANVRVEYAEAALDVLVRFAHNQIEQSANWPMPVRVDLDMAREVLAVYKEWADRYTLDAPIDPDARS